MSQVPRSFAGALTALAVLAPVAAGAHPAVPAAFVCAGSVFVGVTNGLPLASIGCSLAAGGILALDGSLFAAFDVGLDRRLVFAYDANGQAASVVDSQNRTTTFTYDTTLPPAEGRLQSVTASDGRVVTYTYDADPAPATNGKLDTTATGGPLGNVVQYTYDAGGNRLEQIETTPIGSPTLTYTYSYDPGIQRLQDDGPVPTPPGGNRIQYHYDDLSHPTRLTDRLDAQGNTTRFMYDAQDNVVQAVDDNGTPGDMGDDRTTRYTYDADHRLMQVVDPLGSVTQFAYDAQNRLVSTDVPEPGSLALFGLALLALAWVQLRKKARRAAYASSR
jgi:YD repeat-containing protein